MVLNGFLYLGRVGEVICSECDINIVNWSVCVLV